MSRMAIAAIAAAVTTGGCAMTRGGDPASADARWQALDVMGPMEAGLLYHQRAGTKPDARLAYAWGDVCGELDRTAREAAAETARPRLVEADGEVRDHGAWRMPLRQTLGAYDLRRGGFASPLHKGAVIRFDRSDFCNQELLYLVAFRNGDDYPMVRIREEEAKQFVRDNPARTVIHDLEVEPVGWQPGPPGPTLLVDVVRLRTRDAQGGGVLYDSAVTGHGR